MARVAKNLASKVGLPPGTLLYFGDTRTDKAHITVLNYNSDAVTEINDVAIADLAQLVERPGVTWIHVQGLTSHAVEGIGRQFAIHPLVLEDILHTNQRPKLGDYGEYLCVIVKSLAITAWEADYKDEQVSFILGPNYVISFMESLHGDKDVLANVYERIKNQRGKICRLGADYLFYALLDCVVDHYFLLLEHLGEKIEILEDEIAVQPRPELLHELHALKHDLLFMRKAVWPVRELVSALERGRASHIQEATFIYLRDVYDHVIQVIETVEIYRDMLSGMLDIYLSTISNRMSEVMKMLTIISTIFIPLTFIAGVYGMNFEYMPELRWEYGYFLILSVMLGMGLLMVCFFRKKRWL
ncbi:Magnesium transport protein CorA [uncultured Sporomusa sp.]|uniref:Magnesium transport protein CorA n=1 Tax=uncultured Sporomusa sp. TaxID=307249 RepID=A0A212LX49_9FIRM|nr:magnesium/cobalt transporter CorA [uncultured Sporomusa sp.]SCM82092.1 Magnesium transport protein CorA [uncultured Sporomusa sp.]